MREPGEKLTRKARTLAGSGATTMGSIINSACKIFCAGKGGRATVSFMNIHEISVVCSATGSLIQLEGHAIQYGHCWHDKQFKHDQRVRCPTSKALKLCCCITHPTRNPTNDTDRVPLMLFGFGFC